MGLRLREHREQLGLTSTVVGKTTGIGGTNLSAIEIGKRRLTAVKLTDLARVYELPADELVELETIDPQLRLAATARPALARDHQLANAH